MIDLLIVLTVMVVAGVVAIEVIGMFERQLKRDHEYRMAQIGATPDDEPDDEDDEPDDEDDEDDEETATEQPTEPRP